MAVRVEIGGRPLLNADSYSVAEDSTPLNPSDQSGGTAQINFSVPVFPGWRNVEDELVTLRDDTQGFTQAIVTAVSEQNGKVQITADSRINALAETRTALPYRGTLGGAIRYYLSLVGITTNIVVEDAIASTAVVFPGWQDDVYQRVARALCPAFGIEMSLVSNNITFRRPRQTKAILHRVTDMSESLDNGERAQRVKQTWYKTKYIDGALVYPPGGWNSDVEVLEVNASEVKVYESVEISASLSSVIQPTCVLNVGPEDSSASVYTVSGTDGFPIPPDMWKAFGGELRVEINEDTRSLKVTIRGMDLAEYSPYSIAVSSGDGTNYSTLRVLGTGVSLDPQVMDVGTGLTADQTSTEYGDEVDNEFINDYVRAGQGMSWQVAQAMGPTQTLTFSAAGINRAVDSGSTVYATVADFDALYSGLTTDDWDAVWAGKTTDDWDAFWKERVGSEFANQAFGNVAGARVVHDGSIYRIRTASNSAGAISATAERDNTVDDFDRYYAGMTTDDWDAMWVGKTIKQFDTQPFPGIRIDGTRPVG